VALPAFAAERRAGQQLIDISCPPPALTSKPAAAAWGGQMMGQTDR